MPPKASAKTVDFILQGSTSSEILLPLQQEIIAAHRLHPLNTKFRLNISSAGGEVELGLSMVSLIHAVRRTGRLFDTHVLGAAYSMAAVILQAGSHRTIDRYGFLMLHKQNLTLEDSFSERDLNHELELCKMTEGALVDIVATRAGIDLETIRGRYFDSSDDVYMNAVVGLEQGLVDEILDFVL